MPSMYTKKSSIVYLAHGAGPLPLLNDPQHDEMCSVLKDISSKIRKPSAIVMFSAHWEEKIATITSAKQPSLIYDYYGFPAESYEIQYPASGEPELAKRLQQPFQQLFPQQGIEAKLAANRGFDHGMFVPLKIMYPDADIPCSQISWLCNR